MYAVDVRVRSIDPAWPITAEKPAQPTIHLNPKFLDNKQTQPAVAPRTVKSAVTPVSTPAKPANVVVDQQAEVRQQVFAKQQELLKLQQQRLELELLQAKVKLEEQTRQLQIKSQQQHQPALADPRTPRRSGDMRVVRDPRIQKMMPSVIQTPLPLHPTKAAMLAQQHGSLLNAPSAILGNRSNETIPSKIVVPSPSKSGVASKSTQPLVNSKQVKTEPGSALETAKNTSAKTPKQSSTKEPATSKNSPDPMIIDLTNDEDKSPTKGRKANSSKKNSKSLKKDVSPQSKNRRGGFSPLKRGRDDRKSFSVRSTIKNRKSRSQSRSRTRSRSPPPSSSRRGNKKVDKKSSGDDSKKASSRTKGADEKKNDEKSNESSTGDVDLRFRTEEGKENNEGPPHKKAKVGGELDSLFSGKDQDYRLPPSSLSQDALDGTGGASSSSSSSNERSERSDKSSRNTDDHHAKQKNWAQYKAVHPDEFKSPLRPVRDNSGSHSSYYEENLANTDRDLRHSRSARLSTESRESRDRGFDRLGRPLLSRIKSDRRQDNQSRWNREHDPWQTPEEMYLSQISLMLEKQDEILREAEHHLQAGLITPAEFQSVILKFEGLKQHKIRLTLSRDAELAKRNPSLVQSHISQPGLCLPTSKPIFLDGKMRKIKFFGRRAIVLMEGNEPHEVSFSGQPTSIYLDDHELFKLNFRGECKEFVVESSVHTITFGAPSREVYVDGVPYQANFGGAAVSVHLDGKIHYLRLDGPQPSVELGDEPVRGLPHLTSDDDYDEKDDSSKKSQNGWEKEKDDELRPTQDAMVADSDKDEAKSGDVDMRIVPTSEKSSDSPSTNERTSSPLLGDAPPMKSNDTPLLNKDDNTLNRVELPTTTSSHRTSFREGNSRWSSSPPRVNVSGPNPWKNNQDQMMNWQKENEKLMQSRRPLLDQVPGMRQNFNNFHHHPTQQMSNDEKGNEAWNNNQRHHMHQNADWDWRMGPPPNRFPNDNSFGNQMNSAVGMMQPGLMPSNFQMGNRMMGSMQQVGGGLRPNYVQGAMQQQHRLPMQGFDGGMNQHSMQQQQQNFMGPRFGQQRFGLLGNQPQQHNVMPRFGMQMQQDTDEKHQQPLLMQPQQPSLDISSLLSKLVSSGLIHTEKPSSGNGEPSSSTATSVGGGGNLLSKLTSGIPGLDNSGVSSKEMEDEDDDGKDDIIPRIELSTEALKMRFPGVTGSLYRGTQCASCGMRFRGCQQKYSQHLDWHFRANRREKDGAKKAFSRKWFYDVEDWIQFEEIEDLEDRARSFFELQAGEEQFSSEPAPVQNPSVPASQDQTENVCVVCSEPFQLFWVEEEEEWHLRGAIRKEGKCYHPLCYDDFVKASQTPASEPETPASEPETPTIPDENVKDEPKEEIAVDKEAELDAEMPNEDEKEEKMEVDSEVIEPENPIQEGESDDVEKDQEEPDVATIPIVEEEETQKDEPAVSQENVRECDLPSVLEEEIIGVISDSDKVEDEEESINKEEKTKLVVLQPTSLKGGKIVMKVKAESIQISAGASTTNGSRPSTPTLSGTDKDVARDNKEPVSGPEEDEFGPLPPDDPNFNVLSPVNKGKELSGLCCVM